MTDKLKVGIIGTGRHAVATAYPCLKIYSNSEITAIAGRNQEKLELVGGWYGINTRYTDYRKMLERETMDAVVVIGSPQMQYEIGKEVIESGRHLIVEKPPTDSLEQALELESLSKDKKVQVGVGFMKRFATNYVRAKEWMNDPEFGQTSHILLRFCHGSFQGSVHDMLSLGSIHIIDLARFFMGDYDRISFERIRTSTGYAFAITVRFKSGCIGNIHVSENHPRVQERVEISGEECLAVVDNGIDFKFFRKNADAFEDKAAYDIFWRPDAMIPPTPFIESTNLQNNLMYQGFIGEYRHFADALLSGDKIFPNISDGVKAYQIIDILEKHESGIFMID